MIEQSIGNVPRVIKDFNRPVSIYLLHPSRYAWATVKVDGAPNRGGMLGPESTGEMRCCLSFRRVVWAGARTLQESSCTKCGALTLT